MDKDQALRLALEDLKSVLCDPRGRCCINGSDADRLVVDRSLAAIKQALSNDALDRMADNERELGIQMQPEPEILGWATHHDEPMLFPTRKEAVLYCEDDEEPRPLYTSSPKREPLTWQPIATAPKETEVLVYGDGATHVARLVPNGWAIDDGGGLAYINTPTHWMPLPKPPIEAAHRIKGEA